ncbi:mCG145895, partial [Mus musculus]
DESPGKREPQMRNANAPFRLASRGHSSEIVLSLRRDTEFLNNVETVKRL